MLFRSRNAVKNIVNNRQNGLLEIEKSILKCLIDYIPKELAIKEQGMLYGDIVTMKTRKENSYFK